MWGFTQSCGSPKPFRDQVAGLGRAGLGWKLLLPI